MFSRCLWLHWVLQGFARSFNAGSAHASCRSVKAVHPKLLFICWVKVGLLAKGVMLEHSQSSLDLH